MTLAQPKKVNYSANQRLDLLDKLAELSVSDDDRAQLLKAVVADSPDGRVFSGWRTSTVNGANNGFAIAAESGAAIDRAGNVLILDGSSSLTVPLSQNVINYVYAYYTETPSDPDTRRFFQAGAETLATTYTRLTRTPNLYRTTTSYGTGTPQWAGFQTTAHVGGKDVELLPLYAVAVDNSNTITAVVDFRPMFAMGVATAGNNQYEAASGNADFPFNFAPSTNAATLNVTSVRQALCALADRVAQIKGTSWWADAANQWSRSGSVLSGPTNTSSVAVYGDLQVSFGGIKFYTYDVTTASDPLVAGGIETSFSQAYNAFVFQIKDYVSNSVFFNYGYGSLALGKSGVATVLNGSNARTSCPFGVKGIPPTGANAADFYVSGKGYIGASAPSEPPPANGLLTQGDIKSLSSLYTPNGVHATDVYATTTTVSNYKYPSPKSVYAQVSGFRAKSINGVVLTYGAGMSVDIPANAQVALPLEAPIGATFKSYKLLFSILSASGTVSYQFFTHDLVAGLFYDVNNYTFTLSGKSGAQVAAGITQPSSVDYADSSGDVAAFGLLISTSTGASIRLLLCEFVYTVSEL